MRSADFKTSLTVCAVLIAVSPATGWAAEKCSAKVQTKTGALEISAGAVGEPGTLAERTPPECVV